ncbi:MAG: lipid-A-disaccharide synthase [Betaproteobacteria bacterium]|nr:lipid-A-disaccharide synthase [Betaproteobacteria bacterium]
MAARIAMVAGEASGDLLGGHLIAALKTRLPEAHFYGIGGPEMAAQGFESWWPSETLAVNGISDALKRAPQLFGIRNDLARRLLAQPPDLFVGIDAPDFNLGLEKKLKTRGITTVHYVSPTIWAWRPGRARTISHAAAHVLALFPFEPELLQKQGIPATFVGHPLADTLPLEPDRAAARSALGIADQTPVVALLPGSREGEVRLLAETFIQTARLIREHLPQASFLVPLPTGATRSLFAAARGRLAAADLPIAVLSGRSIEAMTAADIVLVASGTATLEAALLKRPMVVAYRLTPLSWLLGRLMVRLPHVSLPNILADRLQEPALVSERLQHEATPERLAADLIALYEDEDARNRQRALFSRLHQMLRQNTAERAADALIACLPNVKSGKAGEGGQERLP